MSLLPTPKGTDDTTVETGPFCEWELCGMPLAGPWRLGCGSPYLHQRAMDAAQEGKTTVAASPEPVTLEQALVNAVCWATRAGTLAMEQKRDVMAAGIAVAAGGLRSALAKVQREIRVREAREEMEPE